MEWEVEELCKLGKIQPEMLEAAFKELWQRKPALYKSVIINAYLDEKINLGKAAELLGMHRLELQRELREKGVPIRVLSEEDVIFRLFADLLGKGESSCLSIAISRELKVLTDDKDARKLAQRRGVPVSGTIGVLVEAVREGLLSIEKGNAMLSDMIEKGYFSPFETLDELKRSMEK